MRIWFMHLQWVITTRSSLQRQGQGQELEQENRQAGRQAGNCPFMHMFFIVV